MSRTINREQLLNRHLGCYGEFQLSDAICKKQCAIRIRCAIDSDQKLRLEMLEEMVSIEEYNFKLQ